MSVAVKKKPVTPSHPQLKFGKKKPNYTKKKRRLSSYSSQEKEKGFVPGGDVTDPLNLKDPDLTLNYTPSPDHNADLPTPIVFVDQSDPLCLKRSPKRKRERKNSRHKSSASISEHPESAPPSAVSVRFNEKAKKFCYGNYSKYYGYRNPDKEQDVRLKYFDGSMFAGKDVLDLGCNIGHITLTIAKEYEPKKIVGVDIDGNLINVARKNIRRYLSKEKSSKFPVSMQLCYGPLFGQESNDTKFPHNIAFRKENWVPLEEAKEVTEMFDVIMCLSVTKWVHLNWGDDGIKNLFKKMYQSIRPGGKLVLECQHWKSYARRKKLTPAIYKNYAEIQILPYEFPQYLQTIGFVDWQTIGTPFHTQKGFRRPIWIFSKPKTTSDTTTDSILSPENSAQSSQLSSSHPSSSQSSVSQSQETQ